MGANSRRLVDEQRVVRLKHQAAVGLDVRRGLGVWRALGLGAPRSLGTRCGLGARCSLSVPRDLVVPRGLGGLGVCELELAHAPLHHVGVAAGELVAERPEPELHPSGRHAAEVRVLERGPRPDTAWNCAVAVLTALALAAALALEPALAAYAFAAGALALGPANRGARSAF